MSEPVTARILATELLKTYGPGLAPPCARKLVAGPASTSSPCSAAGGPALTRFEKAVTYFPVVLEKATPRMRAERLNWVTDPYVIKIKRFKVLEKCIQALIVILAAMSGKEKDRVWPFNVLAPEFERMFSADPCYRVV